MYNVCIYAYMYIYYITYLIMVFGDIMIIKWNSELANGIDAFDKEHMFLVETLNNVYNLLKEGRRDEAKSLFNEKIVNYTVKHFAHEEEVMEKYNYPDLENHKKIHEIFLTYSHD